MEIRKYDSLPRPAEQIRIAVFMEEQGFQKEFDEVDEKAVHFVLFQDDVPIGTCRVFTSDIPGVYILGRLAVLKEHRGCNAGAMLVERALDYAREMGGWEIHLHAQLRRTGFYAKFGFMETGNIEDDEGCPHVWMTKTL